MFYLKRIWVPTNGTYCFVGPFENFNATNDYRSLLAEHDISYQCGCVEYDHYYDGEPSPLYSPVEYLAAVQRAQGKVR